jgi:cell wall-associated NlpC family hydrolase
MVGMRGLQAFAIGLTEFYPPGEFGYVWGSQGQLMTEEELARLKQWYGATAPGGASYYDVRARRWLGKKAADCSGLVMYIFTLLGIYEHDMCADDLMRRCKTKAKGQPGDLVFVIKNGRAVHVGIRIGGFKTVHCRGTDYGLVITDSAEYRWDIAGEYPDIPKIKPVEAIERLRKEIL